MPPKKDQDSTYGIKLLRLFRKLMLDGRKHFQTDLAEEFQCSPQTIIRLIYEVESVIGVSLESGLENRRRWYQIHTVSRSRLGLEFEELRYLSVCRDLAKPILPEQIYKRVDETIFNLAVLMADQGYAKREHVQKEQYVFFAKGKIDYSPHLNTIDALLDAIEDRKPCLLSYKAGGETEVREHRFLPKKIISLSNALYVLGAILTDNFLEVRHHVHFAIHRIQDITVTTRTSSLTVDEVSPDYFGLPWHKPRWYRIHCSSGKVADYIRERIFSNQQNIIEQEDGSLILEIFTHSEPELLSFVRSFGEGVKLL